MPNESDVGNESNFADVAAGFGPDGKCTGTPAYTGKINCSCIIFPDCPMFKRKLKNEQFVFSPETIQKAAASVHEKIRSIAGLDGIYLSPSYIYRHNYLAVMKKEESTDDSSKNTARNNEDSEESQVVDLSRLEFIELADETLVQNFLLQDTNGSAQKPYSFVGGEPAHHMWIDDGSLYVSETVLPSEFEKPAADKFEDFKRQFYPSWGYVLYNTPPDAKALSATSQTEQEAPYRHMPYQSKVSPGDPIEALQRVRADGGGIVADDIFGTGTDGYYKNINPGIHWRVLKRTPLFQGEDFWVEFHRKSFESDISITQKAKFKTREGYEFLDPYNQPESDAQGEVANIGIIEVGKNNEKIEDSLKSFDLSDQAYYIIEIGYKDPLHHYFIILAERQYPIFCHAGKVWIRKVNEDAQSGSTSSSPTDTANGEVDCQVSTGDTSNKQNADSGGNTTKVEFSNSVTLRRLSRYNQASSSDLLKQEQLRVTVRQHLGKIVVTFSGFENDPWIISRSDLTPVPEAGDSPDSDEDFQTEKVPMIIPNKRIALMGGNAKVAYSFGPLSYDRIDSVTLNQRLSVPGPVNMEDINLFLRDKGLSKNTVFLRTPSDVQFTQEAEQYREFIDGESFWTDAIEAQPGIVEKYGKAPDAQRGNDQNRDKSVIQVYGKDCTKRVGSEAPYLKVVEVVLSLLPGDYVFKTPTGDLGDDWICKSCITPIFTGFRLFVPAHGEAFASPFIDVGHHVMKVSESWQETDLLRIQHSGRIQFLINHGMDSSFSDGRPNYTSYLRRLADKNFFVQLSMWWDEGGCVPTPTSYNDRVIFTGICTNASIVEENGKHIMSCDMQDYSKILQEQVFLNSPFFDKMRDFNAVSEIIRMAGFRDDNNSQPGSLIKRLAEGDQSGWFQLPHNGETTYNQEYSLPGSYSILQDPMFKFKEGTTYADAINKMGQIAGKVIYFDRLGVFHYEKLPYDQELFGGQQGSSADMGIKNWEALSKIDFFASPKDISGIGGNQLHRLVFDSYTVSRDMDTVINQIHILSTTPNGELLIAGHTNFDSLYDIEKPGFVGYTKTLLQMEGIFGDEQNVKWMVKNYTKLFLPPIKIKFKILGHNMLKALDIVTFRGLGWRDKQVLIIGSINSEIDAQTQTWFQDLECYWIFPSENIDWGTTNEITIGVDNRVTNGG